MGGGGNDKITGGRLNDKIDGGKSSDVIDAGEGDDTIIGSAGDDILYGGVGSDLFDFQNTESGGFSDFAPGTDQQIDGGEPDGAKPSDRNRDEVLLPGNPSDYRYTVDLRNSWTSTITIIEKLNYNGTAEEITLRTSNIEAAMINGLIDNPSGTNAIRESALQMVEVYGGTSESMQDRGWHAVAAIELGMLPSSFGKGRGEYEFLDGVYVHKNKVLDLFVNDTTVTVLTGVIDEKKTLSVSIAGSGKDVMDWVYDITQWREPFYKKHEPLIEAIKAYLTEQGNKVDQILLSGHSLGGAMVQHLADDLALIGYGAKIKAFTFGTIGGEIETVAGKVGMITNFIHTGDIANLLNLPGPINLLGGFNPINPFGQDGRGGTKVFIDTVRARFPWTEHYKEAYQEDVLALLRFAADVESAFGKTTLATALRAGDVWKGDSKYGQSIQVAPGTMKRDTFSSDAGDNFVLGGGGADKIFVSPLGLLAKGRIFDGGAGFDTLIVPLSKSLTKTTAIEFEDGATKLSFGLPGLRADVGDLHNIEMIVYANGVQSLDGRRATIQKPSSAAAPREAPSEGVLAASTPVPTFHIDPTFDYADAGNGAMNVIGSRQDDIVYVGRGNKTVSGKGGDDIIIVKPGDAGVVVNDTIRINGGTGQDIMIGGNGNEIFIVDNAGDLVSDIGGRDTVRASVSFALADGLEALVLTGPGANSGSGNNSANRLTGNSAANTLVGLKGDDALRGKGGSDNLYGGEGKDKLVGNGGHDELAGNAGKDIILGGKGRDVVAGGAGPDTLSGGKGFDTLDYSGSSKRVVVDLQKGFGKGGEAQGDKLSGFEGVIGSGTDDMLLGSKDGNRLIGGEGADVLNGRGGQDWVDYSASDGGVTVNLAKRRGAGSDAEGDRLINIERVHGSAQNDKLIGDKGKNVLVGDEGKDRLAGGGGRDVLNGGTGHDELLGGGGHDKLSGGKGRDKLIGGIGKDLLDGGAGNDKVLGGGGADTFIFDLGSDRLIGGKGRDTVEFDGAFGDYGVTFGKKVIVTFADDRDVLLGMERLEFAGIAYERQGGQWVEFG
ncbi:hypothetical protein [Tateyamaria sp. syn59]|uniref:hypothetical protein n=1 Tax=Tateyamaria sp. syn59 TaxID=2576942 RepID=UPI0011BE0257|nr:hypothetical protein [Tateyamaria sp. syn59]